MDLLDYQQIRAFYNQHTNCWSNDLFSQMTTSFIDKYVNKIVKKLDKNQILLNAGSGGKIYNTKAIQYHIDIAENTLQNIEHAFVGNIIDLPFEENSFDCIICVGTVINYCEIEKAIQEFQRVSKKDALLILEYERSGSGLIAKELRNMEYSVFCHTYFDVPHKNLLYSDTFVKNVLAENGFTVLRSKKFNTTIPFLELITSEKLAHKLTAFEPIFRTLPIAKNYSHNNIMICKNMNN